MATNKPQDETRNSVDEVNDTLTGLGEKVQNNPRIVIWGSLAIVAVIAIVLLYVYAIRQPGKNAADKALGQADIELLMGNDSIALAKYRQVADKHGYQAGNLAKLNAAIILYQDKKYDEAVKYLKDYDPTESVIGASSRSLLGDCYVNLEQYDNALDAFRQAVKISDNNPHYTPLFLLKEATVYRHLNDFKNEAKVYAQIVKDYPNFGSEIGIDIQKYLKRAEQAAATEK